MKLPVLAIVLMASCPHLWAADWAARLQSPDINVRRQEIDRVQTLDDPRLPEACLPLLTDEGRSIRRQAARAIGSRFDQVAPDRVPVFVTALQRCAREGPEDVTLMADRAVGLLTRKFRGAAFSSSPDGRWLLFEQRRLPVVADIQLKHRQMLALLCPDSEMISHDTAVQDGSLVAVDRRNPLLKLMVTSDSVEGLFSPHWHPKGEALALQPHIQRRFYRPIAIWRASDGAVRTWSVNSFRELYGKRFPHWSSTTDFVKWSGRRAIIHIYDLDNGAGPQEPFDPQGIFVSLDIDTWKIRLE